MKSLRHLALVASLASFGVLAQNTPNILFVDSSFPPIVSSKLGFRPAECAWLREDEAPVDARGPCYDVAEWSELSSQDVSRLRGLIDSLSSQDSVEARAWQKIEADHPEEARRVKGRYLLSVHGTRAVAVAALSSQGKMRPLALRSLTSKAGADVTQSAAESSKTKTLSRKPYDNGCALLNWTSAELEAFTEKGALRNSQTRIADELERTSSLKIVNLSLGYKRSWIQEDFPKCTREQVDKEYSALTASWLNLFNRYPDRLFVVAAGNESENFDKPELRDNDLWARLSDVPNLLLVGSMTVAGTRLSSSNFGLPVHTFALGELIPALTPLPTVIAGHPSRLQGTSFSAPLVSGRALSMWQLEPKLSATAMKKKVIETFASEQLKHLFAAYEKLCRGEKSLDACLETIAELISRPLLWLDTHELYVKGRHDWNFKPFPVEFQKDLPVLGQTRLMRVQGEYVPGLILKPSDNPYELLITIHHEIYHFSSSIDSIKSIGEEKRIGDCVTPYQLALLKDEIPAYEREAQFFERAPTWFRKKLTGKKSRSELLQKNVDAPNFYKELNDATTKDPKFLVKRLVDLGAYPPCVLKQF